ncbi:ABC transporter ATP-binding protein [Corynebacterium cystitidis]|uniref:ABC transporter ATP-binding protein n=1 Tax=Corynebacterium cystitidis TaxID=35757 RepID=UPI00211DD7F8|nr:ABC transporter ATP-binding protein [Corynebacterium cystitidis]
MRDTIIKVDDLTRTYGRGKSAFTAVHPISFEVYKGEVYGLLGTNGAGKTSTLELIEGLARPTGGTVTIMGLDPLNDRHHIRPHLSIMLQSGGLPQQLTVEETMRMWAGLCSNPLPITEVLENVELTHRTDIKVGALSGGEQRRLDLACALVGNPQVLFLDEPTTGLDPESRRRVWELLTELKSKGVTMMLTTHYLEEAELLCDRLAIMHQGEIHIEGTVEEITHIIPARISYENPANPGTITTKETRNLQKDTLELLTWAQDNNLTLNNFVAKPATLEQVFTQVSTRGQA